MLPDRLNRIAAALGVEAADLVRLPDQAELPVAAVLSAEGVFAPVRESLIPPPRPEAGAMAISVSAGIGDYRAGDTIWCARLAAESFGRALNRDVLVPRPGGRFLFGRLIGREGDRLQLLPLGPGQRQQVISDPAWIAEARTLVRAM